MALQTISVSHAAVNGLLPLTFQPLPLGSIMPLGWLNNELELMASGLAGHEHDFYLYVAESSWLGGDQEYSDLNEGYPYWLNGAVPLAYSLDNSRVKAQVHSSVEYVLAHQSSDGWLGPESGTSRNFWARYPLCMGLVQLAEANSTWETPVLNGLYKFVELMHSMLADNYTGYIYHEGDTLQPSDYSWGQVRAQDMIWVLQWIYDNHPSTYEPILIENMQYLYDQSLKWEAWYNEAAYIKEDFTMIQNAPQSSDTTAYAYVHGVNVGQGLKAPAVINRFTHNSSLLQTAMDGVTWTFQYHGAASGTILADERLEGLSPYSGSELCTAVEAMFSLSYLYQATGTNSYADSAELAAFNALPVMMTPNWWAHQYMAQPNQPYSKNLAATPFYNVDTVGQTFGLEPNYPCCTVNHPQGYPKFLSASFVRVGSNGLAHALLSPARVKTTVSSGAVSIKCLTNYPFGGTFTYTITSAGAFDFYIRVPAWYVPGISHIQLGSNAATPLAPNATTGLHHLPLPSGTSTIQYYLGSAIRTVPRANNTVAVYRGSLLYALAINSTGSSTIPHYYSDNATEYPAGYAPPLSRDWSFLNTSPWNIAIDPSTLQSHANNNVNCDTVKLADPIWALGAPPEYISVSACEIPWPLYLGSVPGAAPAVGGRKCLGEVFTAKLVPYGSAKVHMAELPTMSLGW